MNRAWIALAGLAALAAAAAALDFRDHAAGQVSPAECAEFDAGVRTMETRDPASARFVRALARLSGECVRRDFAGAILDIESMLRGDLHESAILP